jgi:mRNA-degrading endonuclease RelE of RelBE toxin-antitoxin system
MQIILAPKFNKKYKKLHANQLADANKAISVVIKNPSIGEQKKGDLNWLRVHKFKMVGQLTLLGYSIHNDETIVLTFIDIGSHENFYRDIKKP